MNRFAKVFLVVAVIACVAGAIAPVRAATNGTPNTVGNFIVSIANLKNLPATDPVVAEASLRSAGFDLPRLSSGKLLTEGDVAAIASSLGLRVASSDPTKGFSAYQSDQFLTAVRPELQSARKHFSKPLPRDENSWSGSKGKGKKPTSKSPKKPEKKKK